MVRRWTKYVGQEEAIRLMTWNNSDPSFSLRFFAAIFCSCLVFDVKPDVIAASFDGNVRANSGKGVSRADLVMQLNLLKVLD
jgi:16S rRNA (cytosine967-C5)-methyltransferase